MGVEVIFSRFDVLKAGAKLEGEFCSEAEEEVFVLFFSNTSRVVFYGVDNSLQVSGDRDFFLRKWLDGYGIPYRVF